MKDQRLDYMIRVLKECSGHLQANGGGSSEREELKNRLDIAVTCGEQLREDPKKPRVPRYQNLGGR